MNHSHSLHENLVLGSETDFSPLSVPCGSKRTNVCPQIATRKGGLPGILLPASTRVSTMTTNWREENQRFRSNLDGFLFFGNGRRDLDRRFATGGFLGNDETSGFNPDLRKIVSEHNCAADTC